MIRFFASAALLVLLSVPALARDDGGFGAGFTEKAPSALMESPASEIAQSVPSAYDLQNIMPAAGGETGAQAPDATKDLVKDAATATRDPEEGTSSQDQAE